jgi:hypothetical protein
VQVEVEAQHPGEDRRDLGPDSRQDLLRGDKDLEPGRIAGGDLSNHDFSDAPAQPQGAPVCVTVPAVDGIVRPAPQRPGGEVEAERWNRFQVEF